MSKDNQTELETAILFQRVSDEGKQNTSGKFANMRKLAQSYCNAEMMSGNQKGIKYNLLERKFIHMGSAFKHDVADSQTMVDIKNMKLNGELPERCHMLFANADRLSRQDGLSATKQILALVEMGFVLHDLYDGVIVDDQDPQVMDSVKRFIDSLVRAHNESKRKQRASNEQVYACLEQIRASEKAGKISPLVDLGTNRGAFLMNKVNPKWLKGYKDGKWILNKPEINKIKFVFGRLAEGCTPNKLAQELNAKMNKDEKYGYSIYKKNKHDKPESYAMWTPTRLKKLYDNKCLIGIFEYAYTNRNGEKVTDTFKDYYPTVIDLATFQKVQALIKSRRKSAGRDAFKETIFKGLCACGYCRDANGSYNRNRRLSPKDKNGDRYYLMTCTGAVFNKGSCGFGQTYETPLTSVFIRYLKEVDLQKLLRPESGSKAREVRLNIANSNQRLSELNAESDNIADAISKGMISDNIIKKNESIQTELTTVKADIARYENTLRDLTSTSMASFSSDNLKQVETFLEDDTNVTKLNAELLQVVDNVEVYPRGLPYNDVLNAVGKGYGLKPQKEKVYGSKLPAFRVHFKNGVTRTVIYNLKDYHRTVDIEQAIVISHDSDKIEVSLDWGKTTMDKMTVLGSSKSELNALDKGIFMVIQSWKGISPSKWHDEYLERFFEPSTHKEMRKKLAEGEIV